MKKNFIELCTEYRDNVDLMNELKALNEALKRDIIALMNGRDTMQEGARKASYKSVLTVRFDSKRFKDDHPRTYSKYTTQSNIPRFIVK